MPVKTTRSYDSSNRQDRARHRQRLIVENAERLFLLNGYTHTTIAKIAECSGVSIDTVYKAFGGKPGLIRAIRLTALEGRGDIPAEFRSDRLHDLTDPGEIVAQWGTLTAEVAPLVAPILLLIRDAAASDPEIAALMDEMDNERRERMAQNARRLHDAGHLRAGISLDEATDVLWAYSAPELFELLVLRRKWTPERFGRFVADAITHALLEPAPSHTDPRQAGRTTTTPGRRHPSAIPPSES